MLFQSLSKFFASKTTRRPFRNNAVHLGVEMLEERAVPATFHVTNNYDSGFGTLRQAMLDANAHPGADKIHFNIFGQGTQTIKLYDTLPVITEKVTIDGTTQAQQDSPPIVIDGSGIKANGYDPVGIDIEANGTIVRGLGIENFEYNGTPPPEHGHANHGIGIYIKASDCVVAGCFVGVAVNEFGTTYATANDQGIVIVESSYDNRIGGTSLADRNVISGNAYDGVLVSKATRTTIAGNIIGMDVKGADAQPNGYKGGSGVEIYQGNDNTIGGTTSKSRNLISGNSRNGVTIYGGSHNKLENNFIGVDHTGNHAVGNGFNSSDDRFNENGVLIEAGATYNIVGGSTSTRNVISGNKSIGVFVRDEDTAHNVIAGNYIGLNHTGTQAIPNGAGVGIAYGANHNTVGGPTRHERNVISGNEEDQVSLFYTGTSYNVIEGNYIGLDAKGQHALVSHQNGKGDTSGIMINQGATSNEIGGDVPGTGNVIAGNDIGIWVFDASTNNIDGNYIGLDHTGKHAVQNNIGVKFMSGATNNYLGLNRRNVISGNAIGVDVLNKDTANISIQNNLIGTNAAGNAKVANGYGLVIGDGAHDISVHDNVISGNTRDGVFIYGVGGINNSVARNFVGTDAAGQKSLGNGRHGVFVTDGASQNSIAGNTIAHNGMDGVLIGSDPDAGFNGPAGNHNTVSQNSIFSNGKIGIDLGPNDGPTPNSLVTSSGPNNLLNHPELTLVARHPNGVVTVAGEYFTQVTQTITVEVFANSPGALPQGRVFLGYFQFHATGNSISPFIHNLTGIAALAPPGTKVTTTATDALGNTSEFSAPFTVVADPVKPLAGLVRENAVLIGLLPQDLRLIGLLRQESELIGLMQGQESELIGLSGQNTDRSGSLVRQLELIDVSQQERSELIGLLGNESALIGLLPSDSALIGLFRSQEADLIGLLGTA